ncbi:MULTISPECIES: hypothetical protein [Streptomyces]|uniref:Septum formation-related domain-containing protein n=1 Tax=Streptomyces siderophoricus TaxID=2802281 RepID=A0ABS1MZE5_9ACTN|nr:hypothetical protein [Streptomyces sp. 9-7]MBL1093089.1 hypothetical protein [Streptomyces sp. 9-7]
MSFPPPPPGQPHPPNQPPPGNPGGFGPPAGGYGPPPGGNQAPGGFGPPAGGYGPPGPGGPGGWQQPPGPPNGGGNGKLIAAIIGGGAVVLAAVIAVIVIANSDDSGSNRAQPSSSSSTPATPSESASATPSDDPYASPSGDPESTPSPSAGTIPFYLQKVGDCYDLDPGGHGNNTEASCNSPHDAEVVATHRLGEGLTSVSDIQDKASSLCRDELERKASRQPSGTAEGTYVQYPNLKGYKLGFKTVSCSLMGNRSNTRKLTKPLS